MCIKDSYLHVRNLKLLHGRNLSPIDQENRSKVIVLGSVVANELFGTTDAVGQKARLDGDEFVVVGVLQDQGQSMGLTTGTLAPVSYTHLDVYKRQVHGSRIGGHGMVIQEEELVRSLVAGLPVIVYPLDDLALGQIEPVLLS